MRAQGPGLSVSGPDEDSAANLDINAVESFSHFVLSKFSDA
jgi:hypothetical protein